MTSLKIIMLPLALIVSIILFWLFVKPVYDEAVTLSKTKELQLQSLVQKENDLQQRTAKLYEDGNSGGDTKIISDALPDNEDIKSLITQIEFIVKKEKMILADISVKDTSDVVDSNSANLLTDSSEGYQTINGNMEIRGGYGQLKQLLRDIRKISRIVGVEQLTIVNSGTNEGEGIVGKYTIGFVAYWQPGITAEQVRAGLDDTSTPSKSPTF